MLNSLAISMILLAMFAQDPVRFIPEVTHGVVLFVGNAFFFNQFAQLIIPKQGDLF
jgi:hypothetical protein